MLWDLMATGVLPHWWDYLSFVACVMMLVVGPVAIWLIWTTRPKD
jgi:hypothetical protein